MPKLSKLIGGRKSRETNKTCYIAKFEDKSKHSSSVVALVTIKMVESREIEMHGYAIATLMFRQNIS